MNIFDIRNEKKKKIDISSQQIFFKERDIFFVSMGKNIGWEQNGKGELFARPVIIIKKFTNILFRGIAITTKDKAGKYYYSFDLQYDKWKRVAILSQLRLYDGKRLLHKIGTVSSNDFIEIRKKLTELIQ